MIVLIINAGTCYCIFKFINNVIAISRIIILTEFNSVAIANLGSVFVSFTIIDNVIGAEFKLIPNIVSNLINVILNVSSEHSVYGAIMLLYLLVHVQLMMLLIKQRIITMM